MRPYFHISIYSHFLLGCIEGSANFMILGMAQFVFVFFEFSIRRRIPENEFSDPVEWGWLNPTGGAFSTVADFAKVTTRLKAVTQSFLLTVKRCVTTSRV